MPICVAPVNRVKVKRMQNFPQLAYGDTYEKPKNRQKLGFEAHTNTLLLA